MRQQASVETNPELMDDIINLYFRDIAKYRPLKDGEEVRLARRIKKGDRAAMNKLVKSNLRFVVNVARNYRAQGVEFMDLINIGNMGLIKAALRFDERKNFKFISYAVWWIRQVILQALADQSRIYKMPLNKVAEIYKVFKAKEMLRQRYHRYPNAEEVAEECGLKAKTVDTTNVITQKYAYLDAPVTMDSETPVSELLAEKTFGLPDTDLAEKSFQKKIMKTLNCLTERERKVIILYFGLGQDTSYTLSEIGDRFNITRERVRQLRDKALLQLRNREVKSLYEDYYNN
jgi:RNA polymerase primary sigma factor